MEPENSSYVNIFKLFMFIFSSPQKKELELFVVETHLKNERSFCLL